MSSALAIDYQTADGKWHKWREFDSEMEARKAAKVSMAYWRLRCGRKVVEEHPRITGGR